MNYENIIIIILSIYIYIGSDTLLNNIIFKDLLVNEITKIIILFFIIFNKNHIISLLLLWAYVLSLNYITPTIFNKEMENLVQMYKDMRQ